MTDCINIKRWHHDDCTLGRLYCKGYQCFTLELPDKGNQNGISCIPPGRYKARKHLSPANGACIAIDNVPGRTQIQIHAGNYTRDIHGCILIGDSIKFLDSDTNPDVTNSRATLDKLLSLLTNELEAVIQ